MPPWGALWSGFDKKGKKANDMGRWQNAICPFLLRWGKAGHNDGEVKSNEYE